MTSPVDLVLIHPPYHRRLGSGRVFPIGLGYVAAAAGKNGYGVAIIDCAPAFGSLQPHVLSQLAPWLTTRLEANKPRLAIGIGPCTTSAVRGIKAVAQISKRVLPDVPLIYGGPLASLPGQAPLFFEKFDATAVVPGDGDQAICDILAVLSEGGDLSCLDSVTTQARTASPNVIEDLDTVPFPRREWNAEGPGYALSIRRDLFNYPFATMITSPITPPLFLGYSFKHLPKQRVLVVVGGFHS